ncbi:MAG TPA: hypothetical protein VFU69_05560 [Ktedonobacterales bacterium]|nr:hypothetical protein [Ktedonobacterales bacterium]
MMLWHFWRSEARATALRIFALKRRLLMGALALAMLVVVAACQPGGASNAGQRSAAGSTTGSAAARNHVPPGTRPQFARVTFTTATTYEQARALLTSIGTVPYPWACSDLYFGTPSPLSGLRSLSPLTTPPPSAEQDTPEAYAASHQFLLAYPTGQQINQIAVSNLVVAIDGLRLPACL